MKATTSPSILLTALLFFLPIISFSQSFQNLVYTPDGEVNSLLSKGDTLIVGGDFNHVGKFSGGLARITNLDDNLDTTFPKVIGTIYSIESDNLGGYFIYGNFRKQDEDLNFGAHRRIEYIDSNGNFDPNISYTISQVFQDGKLFFLENTNYLFFSAQTLTQVNGQNCGGLVGIDITTGLLLPWVPALTGSGGGYITDFAMGDDNTSLYLTGDFLTIGGQERKYAAKIKVNSGANNGTVAPWNPVANWDYLYGYADIVFYNNSIILGGSFGQITNPNGLGHAGAIMDTLSGNNYSYLFKSGGFFGNGDESLYFGASISALAIDDDKLYAFSYGTFDTRITAVDLASVNVFSDFSGTIWTRYFNIIATAVDMKVIDNELFIAGKNMEDLYLLGQTNQNPANIERKIKCALKLNANTGEFEDWLPDLSANLTTSLNCMETYNNHILFGGQFTHANVLDRKAVYTYYIPTETVLNFSLSTNGTFFKSNALKLIDNQLFIAGQTLLNAANEPSSAVSYDINTGLITSWSAPNLGQAFAIEVDANKVYLGGNMAESGGAMRTKLFAVDRTTGALDGWAPNPNFNVLALYIKENQLYVGGDFTNISGQTRNRIASYSLPNLTLNDFNPNANSSVSAINSKNNTIWLGGAFTQLSGVNKRLFGGVDPVSGALRSSPNHTFFGQPIKSILPKGCELFLGGGFRTNNSDQCNALTSFNLYSKIMTPTSSLCINFNQLGGKINTMAFYGNALFLGGEFSKINGLSEVTNLTKLVYPLEYFDDCEDYTTVQNGNWNTGSTWNTGIVPTDKNKAIVKHNVAVTSNNNCYALQLEPGGNVSLRPIFSIGILGTY